MDKKKIISLAQIVLGALAVVMIFLPFLKAGDETVNGLKVIFGSEDYGLKFSFMGLVLLLLVVAIVVLPVIKFLKPEKAKLLNIITLVCAVVAAILFFCACTSFVTSLDISDDVPSEWKDEMVKQFFEALDLGIGAILGGIVAILSGAAAAVDAFVIKD